jgi:hypothetical protein
MAEVVRSADQDFTRVCSWCGRVVYEGRSAILTHGICARCLRDDMFEQRRLRERRSGHRAERVDQRRPDVA